MSGKVASAVKWYQEKTAGMPRPAIDSLFCRQAMFLHKENMRDCGAPESPYCYRDLSNTLKLFYMEELEGKGIGKINLGDTRHIAMMNLIISGGSPSMCMELAGHEDINISSHYYANMSNLVECATYELYRRKEKADEVQAKGEQKYSLEPVRDMVRMEGGWCGSSLTRQGNVSDCIRAVGDGGELGDCLSCRYFRPDMQGVSVSDADGGIRKKGNRMQGRYPWRNATAPEQLCALPGMHPVGFRKGGLIWQGQKRLAVMNWSGSLILIILRKPQEILAGLNVPFWNNTLQRSGIPPRRMISGGIQEPGSVWKN